MNEIKTYIKSHKSEEDFNRVLSYVANNFLVDNRMVGVGAYEEGSYEQKYLGIENEVLIRISLKSGRWNEKTNYKSRIKVEKQGQDKLKLERLSSVEKFLRHEEFKIFNKKA